MGGATTSRDALFFSKKGGEEACTRTSVRGCLRILALNCATRSGLERLVCLGEEGRWSAGHPRWRRATFVELSIVSPNRGSIKKLRDLEFLSRVARTNTHAYRPRFAGVELDVVVVSNAPGVCLAARSGVSPKKHETEKGARVFCFSLSLSRRHDARVSRGLDTVERDGFFSLSEGSRRLSLSLARREKTSLVSFFRGRERVLHKKCGEKESRFREQVFDSRLPIYTMRARRETFYCVGKKSGFLSRTNARFFGGGSAARVFSQFLGVSSRVRIDRTGGRLLEEERKKQRPTRVAMCVSFEDS